MNQRTYEEYRIGDLYLRRIEGPIYAQWVYSDSQHGPWIIARTGSALYRLLEAFRGVGA